MSTLPNTSYEANRQMTKEIREQHHALILSALEQLGEAIYEDIALFIGMDRHQVGRRLKELVDAGKIYNTLKTGLTSKGRKANKYAIKTETTRLPEKEHHYMEGETTGADYASKIIAGTKQGKLIQQDLFSTT